MVGGVKEMKVTKLFSEKLAPPHVGLQHTDSTSYSSKNPISNYILRASKQDKNQNFAIGMYVSSFVTEHKQS